ncbi:MAG TPA: hypothetical protein VJZ91_15905, partial [Blastocatellia bacterium]|nr:hypothetical protein [Blastocatellia bacterium]
MIEVLIGPANSGKTETLISRVAEAVTAGRRGIYLVVPSAYSAGPLFDALSEKIESQPSQPLTTFPGLYRTILHHENGERPVLKLIERDRVLRFVIGRLARAGELQYFGETAEMPGLVNALAAFIDELWRSGTSPADFTGLAETRGLKDRDIAQVFAGYAAALDSLSAVDEESAGHAALSALTNSAGARHWPSLVAVESFDFLTALQVRLLSALAARGVEVVVNLTYDEARVLHYWQHPTFARLHAAGSIFTRYETEPKGVIQVAAAALMNEQSPTAGVETSLTDERPTAPEITIVSAPDRAAEVRAAAREIKRLAVEHHITPDKVAIVCRSLSAYAHHLERIFGECAIPLAIETPLAVTENPAVVALLRVLNLAGQSFPRRACLDVWRSPYFDWSEFGLDENAINLLDSLSLAAHITRGREQWARAIADLAGKGKHEKIGVEHSPLEDESEADRRARYQQLAVNLERWLDALTPFAHATREAHFAWASSLIERLRVSERAAGGERAQRDGRALKEFDTVFKAFAHHDLTGRLMQQANDPAPEEISWQAFVSELQRMLSIITYDRDGAAAASVVAQEAHRLRPRRYRAVFVLGLIEGEFPARLTEHAPYTMAEREELRQAGLDLTETANDPGADLLQFHK